MFLGIRRWVREVIEDLGWYFRPTVWVKPNMRALFIEYLELARAFQRFASAKNAHAATIREQMDFIWRDLTDHECEILDSGMLPFPTIEEAMAALPPRGGTVRFGEGVLYMLEPLRFPDKKNIRLIGGNFCSAGTCMEVNAGSRVSVIGCCFDNMNVGPRDWSPRGDIPKDPGGSAIQINVEP